MFETLCAFLLRLYPAAFRQTYGDEAVQLLKDRAQHERGPFRRVRLLIDLAIDLAAISLRGWQPGRPRLARIDGAPRFDIIDVQRPRLEALIVGVLMSVLMFAIFLLLLQPTALANGRPPGRLPARQQVAQAPAFEAISIKPARSDGGTGSMRLQVLANGDVKASALPVLLLVGYAYDVPLNPSPRLSGLPGWRETYDIEAKAPRQKRGRVQVMMRALLADRFKLVMRVEQNTMPVYALRVASGGPHLQKSTIAEKDCVFDTGTPDSCHQFVVGRGHPLNGRAISMDDLAHYIENWTDLPVVNRTSLSGLFAVQTAGWTPMRLPPPPPGALATSFDDLPTLATVLRTLGLELKKQEAIVPVYTVEHIERPAS